MKCYSLMILIVAFFTFLSPDVFVRQYFKVVK